MQVAQRFSVEVQQGDIIVAATDGLFDNVYPDEAASLVSASKVGAGGGYCGSEEDPGTVGAWQAGLLSLQVHA